jgi:hypothetical protein
MKIRQARKIWKRAHRERKSDSYFYRIKKATYVKAVDYYVKAVDYRYAEAMGIFRKRRKEVGE